MREGIWKTGRASVANSVRRWVRKRQAIYKRRQVMLYDEKLLDAKYLSKYMLYRIYARCIEYKSDYKIIKEKDDK